MNKLILSISARDRVRVWGLGVQASFIRWLLTTPAWTAKGPYLVIETFEARERGPLFRLDITNNGPVFTPVEDIN